MVTMQTLIAFDITKVMGKGWGGGGWGKGIFSPHEFFRWHFPSKNFSRPVHEYFLGLLGSQDCFFFHLIFTCTNIFVLAPCPPHKFSNGPSLVFRRADDIASDFMLAGIRGVQCIHGDRLVRGYNSPVSLNIHTHTYSPD